MRSLQSTRGANHNTKRGEWLEAMARRAGLMGPAAVAAKVGVTRQAAAEWFKGGPIKSQPTLEKLADVLGVTAGQILAGPYSVPAVGVNLPVNGIKEGRGVAAHAVAQVLEHYLLVGSTDGLIFLAHWMERLAVDLQKVDPTYDTKDLTDAAEKVREMAG